MTWFEHNDEGPADLPTGATDICPHCQGEIHEGPCDPPRSLSAQLRDLDRAIAATSTRIMWEERKLTGLIQRRDHLQALATRGSSFKRERSPGEPTGSPFPEHL
jgi:hypothetical protein